MIHPLCTGGPSESAGRPAGSDDGRMGAALHRPGRFSRDAHAPNPQLERAADVVLGLIQGMELMSFNPHDSQINPYGIADWYRYLSLG